MNAKPVEGFRLSPPQRRLWTLQRTASDLPYRAWCALEISGAIEVPRLRRVLGELTKREEILRTRFERLPSVQIPIQTVDRNAKFRWLEIDLSALVEPLPPRETDRVVARVGEVAVDCEKGPALRIAFVRLGALASLLRIDLPALCADETSLQHLAAAIFGGYAGEPAAEPTHYADVAEWLNELIDSEDAAEGRRFWLAHPARAALAFALPFDRDAGESAFRPERRSFHLPPSVVVRVERCAGQLGESVETLLLSAWAALLLRSSGLSKVAIGTAFAVRRFDEISTVPGLFARYLPLLADAAAIGFSGLVRQLAKARAAVEPWQEIFSWEGLAAGRSASRSLDAAFEARSAWPLFEGAEFSVGRRDGDAVIEPFKLRLVATTGPEGLDLDLWHDRSRITSVGAACLLDQYVALLDSALSDPNQPLADLTLLDSSWRSRVLDDWSRREVDLDGDRCLQQLFEQRVDADPERVALVTEGETWTYGRLEGEANRIAHRLAGLGVGPETRVGLSIERSPEMVAALLGILKAGGAFVPLDTSYPRERIAFMLADSRCAVVVTSEHPAPWMTRGGAEVLVLEAQSEAIAALPNTRLGRTSSPDNLAYAIYTSGSTGRPKGVMVSHRAILNRLLWMQTELPIGSDDAVLQKTPISFDASIWEVFVPLFVGARLVLAEPGGHQDTAYLARIVGDQGVSILQLVPSLLRPFLDEPGVDRCKGLRRMFCGGETLPVDLARQFKSTLDAELHNLYGPTESSIDATHWPCRDLAGESGVPIGRPIDNVGVRILDDHLEPVAVGLPGEIFLSGTGLARGYLGRPDLTAERFVPGPFGKPGERNYRTGDHGRWRPDGAIEFLGRHDEQVKIRGVRVELGEIETVLRGHPAVQEAVVVARRDHGGEARLVAYLVPARDQAPAIGEILDWARTGLPDAMVPAACVVLAALPLAANGKVDKRALPTPEFSRAAVGVPFLAPRTPTEILLVEIWCDVLGNDRIGVNDNFFQVGGDSILSLQILSRAARQGLRLSAKQMFQHQTVAELAAVADSGPIAAAGHQPAFGSVEETPILARFFDLGLVDRNHWNQAAMLTVLGELEDRRLFRAVAQLLEHHDVLRLRLSPQGLEVAAVGDRPPFHRVDLGALPPSVRAATLPALAEAVQASLDLEQGVPVRFVRFLRGGGQADLLLVVIHHSAVDGVSWRILLGDLEAAIEGEALPPKTTSFRDWAERLGALARAPQTQAEAQLWTTVAESPFRLPVDFLAPAEANVEASARTLRVDLGEEETLSLLRDPARAFRMQLQEVVLAALLVAVGRWAGMAEIFLDLEGHGREDLFDDVDLSRTVGWFTSLYPIRLRRPETGSDPGALLKSVKEQLRAIPGRGLGFGLLRWLGERPLAGLAAPEIGFNYFGQFDQLLGGLRYFEPASESVAASRARAGRRGYALEVNCGIAEGRFQMSWSYSEALHRRETIENVALAYLDELKQLIAFCGSDEAFGYTPSDFPLARLDDDRLDLLVGADRDVEDVYPLSPLQRGLLYHAVQDADAGVYFQQLSCVLTGALDPDAFAYAWQSVVERYPTLRTGFAWENLDEPLQIVRRKAPFEIIREVWRGHSVDPNERLAGLLRRERLKGFDIARPPLMRAHLLRTGEERHLLVWSHHHLILDGWSVPILLRDVFACYEAAVRGEEPALDRPRPYREFLEWLMRRDPSAAESYWRNRLRGFATATPLGIDRPLKDLTAVPTFDEIGSRLSVDGTDGLRHFAQSHQVTLNTLTLAAWALLLWRYSGEDDVLFGTVTAGRPTDLPGVSSMVGLFINTLPVRIGLGAAREVVEFLKHLQEDQVEARQFEDSPLSQVQGWSEIRRGMPLFESLVVFENYPVKELVEEQSQSRIGVSDVRFEERTSYPLSAMFAPGPHLAVRLIFQTQRVERDGAERLLGHLETILQAIQEGPARRLGEVSLLSMRERHQLLVDFATCPPIEHVDDTLASLFERQARATPAALALVCGTERWTYADLEQASAHIAEQLVGRGVGAEQIVGLCSRRTPWMIAGMLGILRAGGAYLPLDPDYPTSRLDQMLRDSGVTIALVGAGLGERLASLPVSCLELAATSLGDRAESTFAARRILPSNLAYLIFTSGSTGRPKGVAIEHRSAVGRIEWALFAFEADELARTLASTSINFDLSVFEIFAPLASGGAAVLVDRALDLPNAPAAAEVTLINTVPSAMATLLEQGDLPASIRTVNLAGEALLRPLTSRVYERSAARRVLNLYGPSEDTTYSTWSQVERGSESAPSIGRPLPGSVAYLVDRWGDLCPLGVPGELFLGGRGLARGYFDRPELTAERFVPNPFGADSGRLYRTGDIARLRADGEIELLGRADQQVKIRGFRIELGEVEAALSDHPDILAAAAGVVGGTPEQRTLAAYFVPREGAAPKAVELRDFLKARLPDAFVPNAFVPLPAMPRNANGKIDRRALPEVEGKALGAAGAFVAPRNVIEEILAATWTELLKRAPIGVEDDFFDLGGDSLLGAQLVARLRRMFSSRVPMRVLFDSSTIEKLARSLVAHEAQPGEIEKTARALKRLRDMPSAEREKLLAARRAASQRQEQPA